MKNFKFAMAAALAAGITLTACGGNNSSVSDTANPEIREPAVTQNGGGSNILVRIGPNPETIDPALNSAVDGANMIIHAFETLLIVDENHQVVPGQAEAYDVSDDGLTYTFYLREGLKWSDGSPLTAADFVYAWKRMADPASAAPYGQDMLGLIKGYHEAAAGNLDALAVTAPDELTLMVELSSPCVYFDKLVTHASMAPVSQEIVEAHGDQWALSPETYIGNGSLKMIEWIPGAHITFAKNEHYWDADKITLNTLTFVLMEDSNAFYNAYRTGELHMIKDLPIDEVAAVRDSEEFHIDPIMGTYYLSFQTEKAPFDNADVRMALSLAIDRDYLANTVMQGIYSPATNFVGPGISDALPGSSYEAVTRQNNGGDFFALNSYEENVEKAKELLAEAGYPDGAGFPVFEYMTNDAAFHKPVAEYLQSCWKETLNINMEIKIAEWATFTPTRRAGDYQISRNGWVYDYDDPSNMLNILISGSGNNDSFYSSTEVDRLLKEANSTADLAEHYQKIHEAEMIILRDAPVVPVAYYNDFSMQTSKLKGTWHSPYGYWYFMYGYLEE